MIKDYKIYESEVIYGTVPLVGIPSGEYFDLDSRKINYLKQAALIVYSGPYQCWMFSDKDYHKIIKYVVDEKKEDIKRFLKSIGIDRYRINADYTVEVLEDVKIKKYISKLPIKFDYAMGDFDISTCGLITLEGCPERIDGDFICSNNLLNDLRFGPTEVSGDYDVRQSTLISLGGAPKRIKKDFICSYNQLSNLVGGPEIVDGNYYVDNCLLNSLEGSPIILVGNFDCSYNLLEDLNDGPDMINGVYDCSHNDIKDLTTGPNSVGVFKCVGNKNLKDLSLAPLCNKIISDIKN
jgi:hypothetical protein